MKRDTPRVLVRVFHRNRWRTSNDRPVCPIPTRGDRGVRRNGPGRRAARLRVLSREPLGARNGPHELEFQGTCARRVAGVQPQRQLESRRSATWPTSFCPISGFGRLIFFMRFFDHQTKHIEVSSPNLSYYFCRSERNAGGHRHAQKSEQTGRCVHRVTVEKNAAPASDNSRYCPGRVGKLDLIRAAPCVMPPAKTPQPLLVPVVRRGIASIPEGTKPRSRCAAFFLARVPKSSYTRARLLLTNRHTEPRGRAEVLLSFAPALP